MIRTVLRRSSPQWLALILGVLAVSHQPVMAETMAAGRTKVRVSDAAKAAEILANGGKLVDDYGGYQVVEVADSELNSLGRSVQPLWQNNLIKLNVATIDTSTELAQRESREVVASASAGRSLRLVQFSGPVKPEWVEQLLATGAEIVSYVPNNAYLIYAPGTAVSAIRAMSAAPATRIQWQGDYLPAYKIQQMSGAGRKGAAGLPADQLYVVQMVADDGANGTTMSLINQLKLGAIKSDVRVKHYRNVTVRLSSVAVTSLATRPEVVSIAPFVVPELLDERQALLISGNVVEEGDLDVGFKLLPMQTNYLAWLEGVGFGPLGASNIIVDVTDSGIDDGTTNGNHIGLHEGGSFTNRSRVVYRRLFGTETNDNDSLAGCDGHGNIDAHIIAGYSGPVVTLVETNITNPDGTTTNTTLAVTNMIGLADGKGYRYGLGVAPFVKVGSSVIFAPEFTFPDYFELLANASRMGATISANSWGSSTFGGYNVTAQTYDYLVRDAGLLAPDDQPMVVVFAAGNDGPFSGSVGSPGTAKNVITVGASENVHPFAGPGSPRGADGSDVRDVDADNGYEVASFSGRGPTADGRHKPDIMAPGTHISGGAPQIPASGDAVTTDPLECFDQGEPGSFGVSGGVNGNQYFPTGQKLYTASSGTSQATPAVAGAAALLQAYWGRYAAATPDDVGLAPSPAMTKAFLMNSARYMKEAGGDLWSDEQGMGLVDLGRGFDGVTRLLVDQREDDNFSGSGQIRVFTGVITDSNQPVRVTLAWTDVPGFTAGATYVNNLDLEVYVNGAKYLGNVFSGEYSLPEEGQADQVNNAESVFLPAGVEGNIAIFVKATEINGDSMPNLPGALSQDFALVAYNVDATDIALVSSTTSTFISEINGTDNGFIDPGETITVSLGLKNFGTAGATNVLASLVASEFVVPVTVEQIAYGDMPVDGDEVFRDFTFVVSTNVACGTNIPVVLDLVYNDQDQDPARFRLKIGFTVSSGGVVASSGQRIVIRDNRTAVPYPSTLAVGQVGGDADEFVISLNGFHHSFAADVVAILANPRGEALVLLNNNFFTANESSTLIFDDSARGFASGTVVGEGRFRPIGQTVFFAPLPSGTPTNFVDSIAELTAGGVEGDWSLFVFDNVGSDAGAIEEGWSISSAGERTFCNVRLADIAVAQTASPDRVQLNDTVTYTISVTNRGPNSTTNVVLVHSLAPTLNLVKLGVSQGSYVVDQNEVTFNLGEMETNGSARITVVGKYVLAADIVSSSRAYLVGVDLDPVEENNFVSTTTKLGRVTANTNAIRFASVTAGPAITYPSTINISGVTGAVKDVQVTLNGVSHGYPRDFDILVVSPSGEKVMLMSDVGAGSSVSELSLVFNDEGEALPRALFGSGVYRPTDHDTNDNTMASPAPAGPYSSRMGAFSGKNPNGIWSLYAYDSRNGEIGSISGGWSLQITLGNSITNDLAIAQAMPAVLLRDSEYTVSLMVTNLGPTNSTAVYVTNILSDNLAVVSTESSVGSASVDGNRVLWTVGAMVKGAVATMDVVVTPTQLGAASSFATVATGDNELNFANNSRTNSAVVELAPGVTESPLPISIPDLGQADRYPSTIVVSNLVDPVIGISVTLNRLSHTYPGDLDVVLVAPNGRRVMLMSDAGNGSVQDISLTFTDSAETLVPQGFLRSGTFAPANYRTENDQIPGLEGLFSTSFSEFVGIDGNGTWSLYVYDRVAGDSGSIAGGWDLVLTTGVATPSLSIRLESPRVVVSWPVAATGFQLQSAAALGDGAAWTTVTSPAPVVIEGQNVITNSGTNGASFFRLAR